jgi:hypothetical protein
MPFPLWRPSFSVLVFFVPAVLRAAPVRGLDMAVAEHAGAGFPISSAACSRSSCGGSFDDFHVEHGPILPIDKLCRQWRYGFPRTRTYRVFAGWQCHDLSFLCTPLCRNRLGGSCNGAEPCAVLGETLC